MACHYSKILKTRYDKYLILGIFIAIAVTASLTAGILFTLKGVHHRAF